MKKKGSQQPMNDAMTMPSTRVARRSRDRAILFLAVSGSSGISTSLPWPRSSDLVRDFRWTLLSSRSCSHGFFGSGSDSRSGSSRVCLVCECPTHIRCCLNQMQQSLEKISKRLQMQFRENNFLTQFLFSTELVSSI